MFLEWGLSWKYSSKIASCAWAIRCIHHNPPALSVMDCTSLQNYTGEMNAILLIFPYLVFWALSCTSLWCSVGLSSGDPMCPVWEHLQLSALFIYSGFSFNFSLIYMWLIEQVTTDRQLYTLFAVLWFWELQSYFLFLSPNLVFVVCYTVYVSEKLLCIVQAKLICIAAVSQILYFLSDIGKTSIATHEHDLVNFSKPSIYAIITFGNKNRIVHIAPANHASVLQV